MKKLVTPFILWYLRKAANLQLQKINPLVIGVAGSSGKSSLTSLLYEMIHDYTSVKSSGGKNSETGIPLSILGISMADVSLLSWAKVFFLIPWKLLSQWKKHSIYVAEMGIDSPQEPKNMSYLLKIVQPTIGIVTNCSLEHSVYFDPYVTASSDKERQEEILVMTAREELSLLTSLPKNGIAIVNLDDGYIKSSVPDIQARKVTVSTQVSSADLFAKKILITENLFRMTLFWRDREYTLQLSNPLPSFYAYEFLFALATALSLEIPLSKAIESLEKHFSLPPGRFSLFEGIKHATIIDSSYNNATFEPISGILDMLRFVSGRRRKVAIIGDMRELGSQSRANHEALANKLMHTVDEVILIGPLLKNYAEPILKRKKFPYQSFLTFTEAKLAIKDTIRENDLILVKGSQNTLFLERVVEMLLAHGEDVARLCRRGEFWDKKRAATA